MHFMIKAHLLFIISFSLLHVDRWDLFKFCPDCWCHLGLTWQVKLNRPVKKKVGYSQLNYDL